MANLHMKGTGTVLVVTHFVTSACCCPVTQLCLFVIPRTAAPQTSLSFTISQNLLKLMSIESVMPSKTTSSCCPLLLLPSIFPRIRVFSNNSALHIRWTKYWSFSFNISPSSEYSRLISFRIEGFYLWGDGVDQTLLESLTQRVRKFLKSPEHSRSFDEQDFTYSWASALLAFFVKEIKFLP